MALTIFIANNNTIELAGLTNSATEVVDTAATVEVTLQDSSGVDVVGQTWPASMPHVAAGLYRATLDYDLVLTHNDSYVAVVDAVGTGGEVGHWELSARAKNRTS